MRRILSLVALASILTAGGAMAQQSLGGMPSQMPNQMPSGYAQQPGMTAAQQQQMMQQRGMYGQQQPGAMPSPMERQQTAQADMSPIGQPPSATPDPANCGTPYEPKVCPPLPRTPLSSYPASK